LKAAISNGVCRRMFPIYVLSAGASSSTSSDAEEYSNSKPISRRPKPTANPFVARVDGVVLAPRNRVASANAADGEATSNRADSRIDRVRLN
jgi:hypothetical protein